MVPGTRLGRYEIVKHLANGGMAEVLLARATGLENFERHVVIKRIRGEQAQDERFVEMFLDEARLAAALHHQNVVHVHDIGQEDGQYFFTMEYVHGEDVRRLLTHLAKNKEKLPLEHVLTIATSALAGLHHAHEHSLQIVHRDVSPANILVGFDGGVKVADFGIAKAALRTTETRSGTLKGKVSYMSPEQCTGGKVDRRSDVFAMGIVLYEMCAVRRLFKAENDFMTMTAIVQGGVPAPRSIRPDLPAALDAIIMKALSLSPDKRYQSAEEMRTALEELANEQEWRLSSTALAAFMRKQFGDRAEPWLTEQGAIVELGPDFDGAAAGMAKTDVIVAPLDLRRSAPIMAAKEYADNTPVPAATTWNADKPTASGTPIAWSPEPKPAAARRWLVAAIGGVALAAILLAVVIAGRGDDEDAPLPAPPAAKVVTPHVEAPKVEAPKVEPPQVEPPPVVEPTPVAAPVAAGSATAKPARPKRPRPRPTPAGSTPKWDPSTLFPKKK